MDRVCEDGADGRDRDLGHLAVGADVDPAGLSRRAQLHAEPVHLHAGTWIDRFGLIAGVLALGLRAAGFLGKFDAEDIENADKKPQEALEAIGAGKLKTLWYGVLPQVLPQYIAYTLYILDRNIRMATVIGLVGAGGVGQELKGRFDMFQYDHVATILIAIFIVVFLLYQFSARLRAKLI